MATRRRPRTVPITAALAVHHPEVVDAHEAIVAGRVLVDGKPVLNPRARIRESAPITVEPERVLRGSAKLEAGLAAFGVEVDGRVVLDVGAAAGGFTAVLLEHGASRVYAVDAGYGQLRGALRQDPRVVNLERTNLGDLTVALVPDPVDVVTLDLSYLSVGRALPQLDGIRLIEHADLVALVKPMFELGLDRPPTDRAQLDRAVAAARRGAVGAGWRVLAHMESPVRGSRGAVEFLLHARR